MTWCRQFTQGVDTDSSQEVLTLSGLTTDALMYTLLASLNTIIAIYVIHHYQRISNENEFNEYFKSNLHSFNN